MNNYYATMTLLERYPGIRSVHLQESFNGIEEANICLDGKLFYDFIAFLQENEREREYRRFQSNYTCSWSRDEVDPPWYEKFYLGKFDLSSDTPKINSTNVTSYSMSFDDLMKIEATPQEDPNG